MSDFKEIVSYFKFNRRGERANNNPSAFLASYRLDENYNFATEVDYYPINRMFYKSGIYQPL